MDRAFLDKVEQAYRRLSLVDARVAGCEGVALDAYALSRAWAQLTIVHPAVIRTSSSDLGSRAARTALVEAVGSFSRPISASWSHHGSAGVAVAAPGLVGVGIDLEPLGRELSPRLQARLQASSGLDRIGIREWTMLEAAVKASPGSRLMSDFRLAESGVLVDSEGLRFAFSSIANSEWVVGLAVRVD